MKISGALKSFKIYSSSLIGFAALWVVSPSDLVTSFIELQAFFGRDLFPMRMLIRVEGISHETWTCFASLSLSSRLVLRRWSLSFVWAKLEFDSIKLFWLSLHFLVVQMNLSRLIGKNSKPNRPPLAIIHNSTARKAIKLLTWSAQWLRNYIKRSLRCNFFLNRKQAILIEKAKEEGKIKQANRGDAEELRSVWRTLKRARERFIEIKSMKRCFSLLPNGGIYATLKVITFVWIVFSFSRVYYEISVVAVAASQKVFPSVIQSALRIFFCSAQLVSFVFLFISSERKKNAIRPILARETINHNEQSTGLWCANESMASTRFGETRACGLGNGLAFWEDSR